ncbi:hypothetical protein M5K25_024311 [Dendrobium thyrsiflorum]|uniref:RNase H type-1 domain-containing protein n=1 Tax=Dendrobium thyrsiflorum TaxID=117978 RepID=A0ABD0U1M7_DENTH
MKSNLAGIEGVIRDHKGRLLLAFGKKRTHWDVSQLELEAVFVICDWMFESKRVIIEGENINNIKFFFCNIPSSLLSLLKNECDRGPTGTEDDVDEPMAAAAAALAAAIAVTATD